MVLLDVRGRPARVGHGGEMLPDLDAAKGEHFGNDLSYLEEPSIALSE